MGACTRRRKKTRVSWSRLTALFLAVGTTMVRGQAPPAPSSVETESLAGALTPQGWTQVEQSIERGLAWLAKQQDANGSFEAPGNAQPAATSLAVMAYLSKGYLPGEGPYGRQIDRGIDFVLSTQRSDGLLAYGVDGKTANYNHAIAGLMLTEVYGITDRARAARLKPAILNALECSRRTQTSKHYPQDAGGWRYLNYRLSGESDLSVTS